MCKKSSLDERITWDLESLKQLEILNPRDRPGALPGDIWRRMYEREAAIMSAAIAEVLAEQQSRQAPGPVRATGTPPAPSTAGPRPAQERR
jgi:hypothetical protein